MHHTMDGLDMLDPAGSMTTLTPMSDTPTSHHQLHGSYHGMNHMMGHHHGNCFDKNKFYFLGNIFFFRFKSL